ncbi:hypothetical protein [Aliiroseovarius marinus]|uniref:hypothetical protein n=1 Tax=Aliiroseovarius marinus TaxID=2500159 RepID=UPI003D7E0432
MPTSSPSPSSTYRQVEIAVHLGVPQTDFGQLVWSLRKDANLLMRHGVLVKRPRLYLPSLRKTLSRRIEGVVQQTDRRELLTEIIGDTDTRRVVLSDPSLMGATQWLLAGGQFFWNGARNLEELSDLLFPNQVSLYISIRNPATLIPAVFDGFDKKPWDSFIGNTNLRELRWSTLIEAISRAVPDCPIHVWCSEESPVIWPRVLQEVTGLPADRVPFQGARDILDLTLTEAGVARLNSYLSENTGLTGTALDQVYALFLKHFRAEDPLERAKQVPSWPHALVEEMTATYLEDIKRIQSMSGVTVITGH